MAQKRVSPWPFVGLSILACTFFIFGGSLIYMHWWLVLLLYVLWIPTVMSASRAFSERPDRVLTFALISVGTYFAAVGVQILTR